jgi:hypothetical protein
MLAMEPLFNGTMLEPVFHGGAAIYRLTPCSAEVACARQPTRSYQLPPSTQAVVPAALLEAPRAEPIDVEVDDDEHQGLPF